MKKVLFTIQWYPPYNSANVLCDDKIIKELIKTQKYEVHCLVYQAPNTPEYEEYEGVKIHRFSKGCFFDYYTKARERRSIVGERLNKIVLRLKQFLTIPWYPNYEPFATRKFAKNAIELHKKEHFDLVISEHHGYDSLFAGHKLKEYDPHIKFMAVLWDPFSGKSPAGYLPRGFAEKRLVQDEAKVLGNADVIVAMKSSKTYHESNSKNKQYFEKIHFLDIPGIVKKSETNISTKFIKSDMINIVYSGALCLPERDPEYIVELLNSSSIAEKVNLIFFAIGDGTEKLSRLRETFKGEMIINGFIGQEELNAVYHQVDALINFGGSNPAMVPSKIFEYMSYGKPIISTYYIDNETSKEYLASYSLSVCIDQRKAIKENGNILEDFIEKKLGKRVGFDEVEVLFSENTPGGYVKLIDEVIE